MSEVQYFFLGMAGGALLSLTLFVFACVIWPRPLRRWLWPRDGRFIHGMIYRKGKEPEHV